MILTIIMFSRLLILDKIVVGKNQIKVLIGKIFMYSKKIFGIDNKWHYIPFRNDKNNNLFN